jgi:acetyl esterase/lipase
VQDGIGYCAVAVIAIGLAMVHRVAAAECWVDTRAHTYKVVDGCEIRADVIHAQAASPGQRPAVMWIHGGALIFGGRVDGGGIDNLVAKKLLQLGYVIVSIDYRLAPETKLPGIVADVQDAWKWLQKSSHDFGIDASRIVVAGGSAGGYLTLMTGFAVDPRPRALVTFYGYGDITSPWYSQPSAFYRQSGLVTREDALRTVTAAPLSEDPWSATQDRKPRYIFYGYCRQNGIWPDEVTGHNPKTEPRWFDAYCPIRNVTANYPPTMMFHGTIDTDVPYDESKNMAARLEEAGVKHAFITVDGAGHGFVGVKPEELERLADQAVAFIQAHTAGKEAPRVDDTRPKTAIVEPTTPAKPTPQPLARERIRETFFVDLSKAANRALADDVANDGKGGWTDQGPAGDMRALRTGKRRFGDIEFDILAPPKSVVVLRSSRRNPGKLPDAVKIHVGHKADALCFLHAAAWFGESLGNDAWFKYVMNYADGKIQVVMMTERNMADWVMEPVTSFPKEEGTFTTVAETVSTPLFKHVSVYRTEWRAPVDRRAVEIRSIEFVGNGSVVPVLLGITGVMER